jgi:hypothetical protein
VEGEEVTYYDRDSNKGGYEYQHPEDRSEDRGRINCWLNLLQDFLQQELHADGSCGHKKSTAHNAQDTGSLVPWSHNPHFPIASFVRIVLMRYP